MSLLVGVDGGGTYTRALAVHVADGLVGRGQAGPSNHQTVGIEGAIAAVQQAVLAATGGKRPDVVGACLAGVDLPEHLELLRGALGQSCRCRVHVENDIAAALFAVPGEAVGVVSSGTGAAIALRQAGEVHRLLALNEFTGPQGGAGDVAKLAVREAILAAQGAVAPTRLTERILALFDLPDHVALARMTEASDLPPWQVARMVAPLCAALSDEGDPGARSVLRRLGSELGQVAGRYFTAQGLRPGSPVARYGALLRGGPKAYREAFSQALRRHFAAGSAPSGCLDAVEGAVLFAAAREAIAQDTLRQIFAR